jgi:GPH family glycoside/pentoside/hexuronide:cation symporter
MNDSVPEKALSIPIRFGWGIGSMSLSLMFNATSLLMLYYLINVVGLGAALAGLLIGAAKIYDAITDPLMGTISDRTRNRLGRRRPYLLAGALISALSFIFIFHLAYFQGANYIIVLVIAALLLNATGYTIFSVPYMAMPPEMTGHYHERTSLMSYRIAAVAAGQLFASVVGPRLLDTYGTGVSGHATMSWVLGAIIFAGGAICFWMTRDAPFESKFDTSAPIGFSRQLKTVWENHPFMLLLGIKLTHLLGLAVFISVLPFLFIRVLQVPIGYLGSYFLAQGALMMLSQPLWVRVSRSLGKRSTYLITAAIYSVAGLSWLLAGPGEPTAAIIARGLVAGFGAGGLLLVGQSMLPDTMEYDYRLSGQRREGILSGVYTTIEKVSFAMGPALTGMMLGAAGYIQSADAAVKQPEAVTVVIYLCASVIPIASLAIGCLLLLGYDLTEERLKGSEPR